jgi:hypothetical protein
MLLSRLSSTMLTILQTLITTTQRQKKKEHDAHGNNSTVVDL